MQSLDSVCSKKNKVEQASKCLAKNTLCLFTLVVIMVFACVLFYENPDGKISLDLDVSYSVTWCVYGEPLGSLLNYH